MLISALSVRLRLSSGNFSRKSSFRSVHSETRIEPGGNGCRWFFHNSKSIFPLGEQSRYPAEVSCIILFYGGPCYRKCHVENVIFFFRGKSSRMEINFFKQISFANLWVKRRLKSYVRLNTDNRDLMWWWWVQTSKFNITLNRLITTFLKGRLATLISRSSPRIRGRPR